MKTPEEYEAWIDLGWDQVLGRFGGVLSVLNRHSAHVIRKARRRRPRRTGALDGAERKAAA